MTYRVVSINIGKAKPLMAGGRRFLSAIGKHSSGEPVNVGRLGLEGDEQVDLSVHGGLDKAVYAYPSEHYAFWQAARQSEGVSLFDEALPHGYVGENLSIEGLLETQVWIGDQLRFEQCLMRVTSAREPCFKFNAVMGFARASRQMVQEARCGFYLEVIEPGTLTAGEAFELLPGQRSMTVAEAIRMRSFKHLR